MRYAMSPGIGPSTGERGVVKQRPCFATTPTKKRPASRKGEAGRSISRTYLRRPSMISLNSADGRMMALAFSSSGRK